MAAKPPKPPGNLTRSSISSTSQEQSPTTTTTTTTPTTKTDSSYNKCFEKQKSTCSCTNISIMQLFHEMKQEFPTVPDHVVNQFVVDNCHDRENCIKNLKQELISYPTQAYPSHALNNRNNNQNQNSNLNSNNCNKTLLKPIRPAPLPNNKINCDPLKQQQPQQNLVNLKSINFNETLSRNKELNASDMQSQQTPPPNVNSDNNQQLTTKSNSQPRRPTTLNFRESRQNQVFQSNEQQQQQQHQQQHPINEQQRLINRPVRTAPPPPIIKHPPQQLLSPQQQPKQPQKPNVQNIETNYNSIASVNSPLSYSDSGESEISVNISLSPTSERSHGGSTNGSRRISAISIQPEPPYSRDFTPQSPRSFTSLNLTLRKPSIVPQSPIDITAGPGLTYSSSSFDAKRGYQKNFHITVTDQGGVFSASRIRPRSCYNTPIEHPEQEFLGVQQRNNLRTSSSEQGGLQNLHTPVIEQQSVAPRLAPHEASLEIIQRQRTRKDQLAKALEQNRRRLEQIQQQIQVLTSPINPGESERLDAIIQRLRGDCEEMLNKLETFKHLDLRTSPDADNNASSPSSSSNQATNNVPPRYRPPRPPPPRLPPHLFQNYNSPGNIIDPSEQHHHYHQLPNNNNSNNNSNNDDGDDQDNFINTNQADGGPPWTCSMCTFQNHPLLNKCECCDNIRIIPGTIRIVPSNEHNNIINNSSQLFSRFSNNLTSINNNFDNNNSRNFINNNNNSSSSSNNSESVYHPSAVVMNTFQTQSQQPPTLSTQQTHLEYGLSSGHIQHM